MTVPPGTAHGFRAGGGREALLENELRPALRTDEAFVHTFALERARRPPLGRLLQLALIAERYPREFPLYVRVVPWRLQLAAMRALARLGRAVGVRSLPGDPPGRAGGRLLSIYMNDHLAAGVLWREVARRAERENRGSELGDALGRVASAIAEDVETFEQIMMRLQIRRSRLKPRLAIAAERVGRLKRNGRLLAYSPLSRFSELDFLAMGIEGKAILWANLRDFADLRAQLPDVDFDGLIERAHAQRAELEPFREQAGRLALRITDGAAP